MSLQSVNKTTGELAPIAGRGSGSGILPHLIINGQPNKTMTVTKGTLVSSIRDRVSGRETVRIPLL